jgi:2-keto-3-deoxygluconate permease
MRIKRTMERVPGGLMVVPLMLGALLNTIDQAHLPSVQSGLRAMGARPTAEGHYEFLRIGGFAEPLFKTGALCLIGLFLFCAGSQMNLRITGKALKKGILITGSKYATGVLVGYALGMLFDPMDGLMGLSTMAVIAAMTNSNGGMYAALTGEYGNHSDVGAVAVLSLNDGPFFTMLALGILGHYFPVAAFLGVLIPIGLGVLLGNLDEDMRTFLKPGESLTIPFFAFALGARMNFMHFLNPQVVGAGLLLGVMTTFFSAVSGILVLKLFREKSQIAAVAEASTAGNAAGTPALIAREAAQFAPIAALAKAQIMISTLTTAVLCPALVIFWYKRQIAKGIDSRKEDDDAPDASRR